MPEIGLEMTQKDRNRHRRSDKFRPVTCSRNLPEIPRRQSFVGLGKSKMQEDPVISD